MKYLMFAIVLITAVGISNVYGETREQFLDKIAKQHEKQMAEGGGISHVNIPPVVCKTDVYRAKSLDNPEYQSLSKDRINKFHSAIFKPMEVLMEAVKSAEFVFQDVTEMTVICEFPYDIDSQGNKKLSIIIKPL